MILIDAPYYNEYVFFVQVAFVILVKMAFLLL